MLHTDRLYVLNDNDTQSYLAAYDKRTGKEVWRVDREEGTTWATPFRWENERRMRLEHVGGPRLLPATSRRHPPCRGQRSPRNDHPEGVRPEGSAAPARTKWAVSPMGE